MAPKTYLEPFGAIWRYLELLGSYLKLFGDPDLCQPGWRTLRASDEVELKLDEINEI